MRRSVLCLAFASLILASGCASGSPEDADSADETAQDLSTSIVAPSGEYAVSFVLNGTGCHAGSWEPRFRADGALVLRLSSAFDVIVDAGQSFAIKDCSIAVNLTSARGRRSFTLTSFHHVGYAWSLDEGLRFSETAKLQVGSGATLDHRIHATSPLDGPYGETPLTIAPEKQSWSACADRSRVTAALRTMLWNNPRKTGSGYINPIGEDAELKNEIVFGIVSRRCGSSEPVPGPGVDAGGGGRPSR
jgi:hypothetical protein